MIVSFNAEVLASGYDHGDFRPFGRLELPPSKTLLQALEVVSGADVLGLTTYPQAAALRPEQLGSDYLLKFRKIIGGKPLAVTRISVNLPEKSSSPPAQQAEWLRRVLRSGYWLDAQLIAYPDASAGVETGAGRTALRVGAQARPALDEWRDVLSWDLVPRLTAASGNGGLPQDAPGPPQ